MKTFAPHPRPFRARRHPSPPSPPIPQPSLWAREVLSFQSDPLQAEVLDSPSPRLLLCCSRQWGKSTLTAIRALHTACFYPGSLVLCLSPYARQSGLFLRNLVPFLSTLRIPLRSDPASSLAIRLPNSSRIIGLPCSEATTRGFSSVDFLVLDEAAKIPDALYPAVRPMLAVSNGRLWLLSTPAGQSGFFFNEWNSSSASWTRVSVPATACPRIAPAFLELEREALGPHAFAQEYLCQFLPADTQLIDRALIDAVSTDSPELPTAVNLRPSDTYYLGLDLGLRRDPTALAILRRHVRPTGRLDPTYMSPSFETATTLFRLQPFALLTPYADIAEILRSVLASLPLRSTRILTVDATGAGDPVVQILRDARLDAELRPVVITAGHSVGSLPHAASVPRHTLLNNLRRMFETREFFIPANLDNLPLLTAELTALGNPRSSHSDDLAFALALAAWSARPQSWAGESSTPLELHNFPATPRAPSRPYKLR